MIVKATVKAPMRAAATPLLNGADPGRSKTNTPIKPIMTAVIRGRRIFSFKNITARIVANTGAAKLYEVETASGITLTA